jgi:hypothetical protein
MKTPATPITSSVADAKPLLQTDGSRWWGSCLEFTVWMTTPTFLQYAYAYLLMKTWRSPLDPYPSHTEVVEALNHCQHVAYWRDGWKYGDPNLHYVRNEVAG